MSSTLETVAVVDRSDWEGAESCVALAERLGVKTVPDNVRPSDFCRFVVFYLRDRLSLQHTDDDAPGAICVNFDASSMLYRQSHPVQPEALLRAAGVKHGRGQAVLDATAGLGQDAFILAAAGCRVTLMERSPVLHALLADGLRRGAASENARVAASVARMTLMLGDSADLSLDQIAERPEVVYLDPMFPERRKSAKVKKNMFLLQQLLVDEISSAELLHNALQLAERRVVVKRPRQADFLEGRRPSHQLIGKTSRFDVYLSVAGA